VSSEIFVDGRDIIFVLQSHARRRRRSENYVMKKKKNELVC
jgi:hypothetical protein